MHLNGFQVEEHGSGYQLTIRVHIGSDELEDNWVGDLMERVGGTLNLDGAGTVAEDKDDDKGDNDRPKGRGRRASTARSKSRNNRERDEASDDDGDSEAEETPRRGRRTRKTEKASPEKGVSRRRGRRKTEGEDGEDDPSSDAPRAGSRRTRSRKSATASGTKATRGRSRSAKGAKSGSAKASGPSDVDLTKACSDAAEVIGATQIANILDEFGVEKVNELEGETRQEFIDRLNDEMENNDD